MGKVGSIRVLSWWGLWTSDSAQVLGGEQAMTSEGRRRAHVERDVRQSDNRKDHLLYIFA